jgi:hypothetical protein
LPVKFIKPLINQTGIEEQQATFECEISKAKWKKRGTDVIVKWYKGDRELRDTIKYNVKRNGVHHSLTIKELEFDDISQYSAVVAEEKTSAKLEIQGKYLILKLFYMF